MSDIGQTRKAMVARILEGLARAPREQRRAAFEQAGLAGPVRMLIDKVARRAHAVVDEDMAAVRASGLAEDEIFELVVCASVGQATRQYEAALAALDAAIRK